MARIPHTCAACHHEGAAQVGQSSQSQLRWWQSFRCTRCDAAVEVDGGSDAPDDVRAALLAEEGTWTLVVAAGPGVAAALRAVLGLSIAQTVARVGSLPGRVVTGTRAEVEHMRREFAARGVTVHLELVEPEHAG